MGGFFCGKGATGTLSVAMALHGRLRGQTVSPPQRLTGRLLTRRVVLAMIKRRPAAAGLPALDLLPQVPGDGVSLERGDPRATWSPSRRDVGRGGGQVVRPDPSPQPSAPPAAQVREAVAAAAVARSHDERHFRHQLHHRLEKKESTACVVSCAVRPSRS